MTAIITQLLDIMFSGVFRFIGCMLLLSLVLGLPCNLVFKLVNRTLRHMNIRKHGWPPSHLDADGDWKPEKSSNPD